MFRTMTFTRLHNVSQMSSAYLVYPGACHSRFGHSIGVMHITGRMYEAARAHPDALAWRALARHAQTCRSTCKQKILYRSEEILKKCPAGFGRDLARMAGLLHDFGHPPYSHAFERGVEDYCMELAGSDQSVAKEGAKYHERLTLRALEYLVLELRAREDLPNGPREYAADLILTLCALRSGDPELRKLDLALRSLYASIVDADRLDAVVRDGWYCGLPATLDATRLISLYHLKLLADDQPIFLPGARSVNDILGLLTSRLASRQRIIGHHRVIFYDGVIRRLVAWLLRYEDTGKARTRREFRKLAPSLSRSLEAFVLEIQSDSAEKGTRVSMQEPVHRYLQFRSFFDDCWFDTELRRLYYDLETDRLRGSDGKNLTQTFPGLEPLLRAFFDQPKRYVSLFKVPREIEAAVQLAVDEGTPTGAVPHRATWDLHPFSASVNEIQLERWIQEKLSLTPGSVMVEFAHTRRSPGTEPPAGPDTLSQTTHDDEVHHYYKVDLGLEPAFERLKSEAYSAMPVYVFVDKIALTKLAHDAGDAESPDDLRQRAAARVLALMMTHPYAGNDGRTLDNETMEVVPSGSSEAE